MASEPTGRERDLILAPNQFAFIQDETKGIISVYVGPNRTSLANTDRPVVYHPRTRKFDRTNLEAAIQEFPLANEGWYIVLENPALNPDQAHPTSGASTLPKLNSGRKVNMPGPVTFPLWPGQVASVIEGHRLRSNQYVTVRVYNEEAAKENWGRSVMKPAGAEPTEFQAGELSIGKLFIIKGTAVSFYIPPTGMEVVPDANGSFIRDAITLERLEYCILLDENGAKRYVKGPAVVFPNPTEVFIERDGQRKFKAIELNEDMGLYVKVIADYEGHKTGEELFITGTDQKIYYPREEHALIKYGDQERHYGVVVADGEARYVLDKDRGRVELVKGPRILLADPRKQVIVRRVLSEEEVALWFPGNQDAAEYNSRLRAIVRNSGENAPERALEDQKVRDVMPPRRVVAGDDFQRGKAYAAPRTLALDTRFEGAVAISVRPGYAVLIANKAGQRRPFVGPGTTLLEYDETLQPMEAPERTVYLRIEQNRVEDTIRLVSRDDIEVEARIAYSFSFEGEPERWFRIPTFVQFLRDRARTILIQTAKQRSIDELTRDSAALVQVVRGLNVEENGMRVQDVEIQGLRVLDPAVDKVLSEARYEAVQQSVELAARERRLDVTRRAEAIDREIRSLVSESRMKRFELESAEVHKELEVTMSKIRSETEAAESRLQARLAEQGGLTQVDEAELGRARKRREQDVALAGMELDQRLRQIQAEVDATVNKVKAISPDLISALQAFGDKYVAGEAVKSLSPLAILGGKSIADVAKQLLSGTVFRHALDQGFVGE